MDEDQVHIRKSSSTRRKPHNLKRFACFSKKEIYILWGAKRFIWKFSSSRLALCNFIFLVWEQPYGIFQVSSCLCKCHGWFMQQEIMTIVVCVVYAADYQTSRWVFLPFTHGWKTYLPDLRCPPHGLSQMNPLLNEWNSAGELPLQHSTSVLWAARWKKNQAQTGEKRWWGTWDHLLNCSSLHWLYFYFLVCVCLGLHLVICKERLYLKSSSICIIFYSHRFS